METAEISASVGVVAGMHIIIYHATFFVVRKLRGYDKGYDRFPAQISVETKGIKEKAVVLFFNCIAAYI